MKTLNRILRGHFIIIGILLTGFAAYAHAGQVSVIAPDKPMPVIVVGSKATECEKFAAEELARYLEKITGRAAAVQDESQKVDGYYIAVGASQYTNSVGVEALDIEEFVIDADPQRLLIVGGRRDPAAYLTDSRKGEIVYTQDRGTLYAVYEFLEQLGVRWYRPEDWGEIVPKMTTVTLQEGRQRITPGFKYRSGYQGYRWGNAKLTVEQTAMGQLFFTRLRQNGNMWTGPKLGGYYYCGWGHAYQYLMPAEGYFAEHPEYYALINGKRSAESGKLCLSNPDVQRIIAEKVIAQGQEGITEFASIEPSDCAGWCQCDTCKAMDDPNLRDHFDPRDVSMSNRVWAFNNIIAQKVREEVPGFGVSGYAYHLHVLPPTRVKHIESNVHVMVAPYSGLSDYSRFLVDPASEDNQRFCKILKKWCELTPHVQVYEYLGCYAWDGPAPILRITVERIRTYKALGVEGVYNQGATTPWGPQGINKYLYCKLLWNPNLDVEKELNLYYKNYYGPAEATMKAYHEMLEDAALHGPFIGNGCCYIMPLFQQPLVDKMGTLIHKAQEEVKGQPIYEKRIYGVWAGYEYVRLLRKMLDLAGANRIDEALAARDEFWKFYSSFGDGSVIDFVETGTEAMDTVKNLIKEVEQKAELVKAFRNPSIAERLDEKWSFTLDEKDAGRDAKWFAAEFDDSQWANNLKATMWWEDQGYGGHDGAAWYRRKFAKPQIKPGQRILLMFGAVDGTADLWMNGTYVGNHDELGPDEKGWESPFWFDVTDQLKDGENLIALRCHDAAGKGGIWKGVQVLVVDEIIKK